MFGHVKIDLKLPCSLVVLRGNVARFMVDQANVGKVSIRR